MKIDGLIKKHMTVGLLISILIFGFIFRIYGVGQIPPGFFADEASIGYNAYTLLHNGADEYGNKFPILFESFGGSFYRPGISVYLTAPFVALFGLNESSIRLSSVLVGTLTILSLFLLAKLIFSSTSVGIFSAFFLAISPWHIHFSRINQEFVYMVFFLTLSIYVFLLSIKKQNQILLSLSLLLFGLSLYTYVVAYFLIPLILIILFLIHRKYLLHLKKGFAFGFFILLIVSTPLLRGIESGKTFSRLNQLSTTNQSKTQSEIIIGMLNTYKDHFMPEFLFQKGDIGYHSHFITRFSPRGIGELYWIQLPLIIFGLFYAFKKNKKSALLITGLLLMYPLGSSTVPFADGGGPFAMRSIIGVIPFQILSALGIIFIYSILKNNFYKFVIVGLIFISIFFSFKDYLHRYFVEYPLYSSDFWGWQYGARDIVNYFSKNQDKYDELLMASEFNSPEIFFKFYSPTDCSKCRIGLPDSSYNPTINQLFALTPNYLTSNPQFQMNVIKTIYYPNNTIAFEIGKVLKK